MEKVITTALLIMASIVAALALIKAVLPALGKSSSALATANSEAAPGEKETGGDEPGKELEFDLKDIFEEAVEVDERLKDLADSQDDVPADALSNELREFLAELEA